MEQKNIEVQRKKGLNLMMKILITAIIPLVILVAFAGLAIRAVGVSVSDKLMQHELKTSVYAVNQTLSVISSGDWNMDGDQLYKGDYNISEHQDVLDAFKENTGLDVTLSWNNDPDGDQPCETGRQPRDRDGDSSRCVSGCERKG